MESRQKRERAGGSLMPANGLTARSIEVLRAVCEGLSDKEIAVRLGIEPRTVAFHKRGLRRKAGNRTTVGLVFWAIEHCYIEAPKPKEA